MRKFSFGMVLAFLLSSQAMAFTKVYYTNDYYQCAKKAGVATRAMITCAMDETKRQNKYLNIAYSELMHKLSEQDRSRLKAIQKKWISYRSMNCNFYIYDNDETLYRLLNSVNCEMNMTMARTLELQWFKKFK